MQEMKKRSSCTSITESNIDRLSDLHDDLILRILSLMDIKTAIHTCILSKRWKNMWIALPHLDFNSEHFNNLASFKKFVQEVLSRCNGNGLFSLRFSQTSNSKDRKFTSRVLRYAASHGVNEVSLINQPKLYITDFLSSCKYLRTLNLIKCRLAEKCCLSYLSRCVKLESLKIIGCQVDCGKTMKISAPRLANFNLCSLEKFELVLSAPKLSTFFYHGIYPLTLSIEGCYTLDKVGIRLEVFRNPHNISQQLYSHVENLLHTVSFCSKIVTIDLGCWMAVSFRYCSLLCLIIFAKESENLQKVLVMQTGNENGNEVIEIEKAISEIDFSGLFKGKHLGTYYGCMIEREFLIDQILHVSRWELLLQTLHQRLDQRPR